MVRITKARATIANNARTARIFQAVFFIIRMSQDSE
jgi:hypothetical protein